MSLNRWRYGPSVGTRISVVKSILTRKTRKRRRSRIALPGDCRQHGRRSARASSAVVIRATVNLRFSASPASRKFSLREKGTEPCIDSNSRCARKAQNLVSALFSLRDSNALNANTSLSVFFARRANFCDASETGNPTALHWHQSRVSAIPVSDVFPSIPCLNLKFSLCNPNALNPNTSPSVSKSSDLHLTKTLEHRVAI